MKVVLATSNRGKVEEIRRILEPFRFEIIVPEEKLRVEEKGNTFLENALIKAKAYFDRFGLPALADDSGLEVEALGGYPGVFSSRFHSLDFGGIEEVRDSEDEANVRKLLRLMKGEKNRRARFVCWVVLYTGYGGVFGYGECRGTIADSPRGEKGFGYDPVFVPEGFSRTMAEIEPEEKDSISHRGKALRNLIRTLERCRI
ncbi:MAG: RdgB/HAM1 family non-canonical purine NTP pyrophosphatase [Aquificota bacterium]|nr:RdgB/HAM1 family non-canonical purine NTP pyrophosphatase [Aquificota bacterium]